MEQTKLDKAFSNGKWSINVRTVGEMIDELSRLPRDMQVKQGFEDSTDIVVFNRNTEPFVEMEDGNRWDDEDEDEGEDCPMEQTQIDFGKMTDLEKCEHFIRKFEAIPEEKWCVDYLHEKKSSCALGHCNPNKEVEALIDLFTGHLSLGPAGVNDGCWSKYQQPTPKLRILAALSDIKAKIGKGEK